MAVETVEYLPGRSADLYGADGPLVLLWHGRGPDERDVLAALAQRVAELGARVVVPDWRSDAVDSGRAQLLASLAFARGRSDRLVLAGWSRGAAAAAGLGLHGLDGWRPAAVVGVAGGYGFVNRDPIQQAMTLDTIGPAGADPIPFHLVHGSADEVVPVERSRVMADALRDNGYPVDFAQYPTDHAGIVGAEYDRDLRRGRASTRVDVVAGRDLTATTIARAAGLR